MKTTTLLQLALALALIVPAVGEARLYRWTDSEGNVHYGDRVPPEHVPQGRAVINNRGSTIERIQRAKTPEELEAERAQREAEEAEERAATAAAARRAEHDRMLLLTYTSVAQIERARDERLRGLQARLRVTEARRESLQSELESARRQAANRERSGRQPGDSHKRIEELTRLLHQVESAIATHEEDINALTRSYEADIDRFKTLELQMQRANEAI
jgi:hypothetical protein